MKRGIEISLTSAAIALVAAFYVWSANQANAFGDFGDWDYYRLLVRGYRNGHLYLDKTPPPELLALADPYDPAQNGPYRLPDASYYKGHYYLYFGAAPAVTLMLPFYFLSGVELTTGAAIVVFSIVAFLTMAGLWLAIRARYFPASAAWIAPLGILGLGSSTHILALLRRPMWWELPIAAGIAFTLLALVAVYRAIHGRKPLLAMAAAGLCVGLAVASRPVCLFASPLLLAPVWCAWRERATARGGSRVWRGMAIAAAIPLLVCGAALMAHNHARFGNPLEFGQNYQLSGAYESQLEHFRARYIPHNMKVLFFQPLRWTWDFPFVMAWGDPPHIPGYYGMEEVAGLVFTFPFVCFALAVPLAWRSRPEDEARRLRATVAAIAGYFFPVALLIVSFFAVTARYIADFASALALLAAVGWLGLEHWARTPAASARNRKVWRVAAASAGVFSIIIGVPIAALLSFDYHGRAPAREEPERWGRVEQRIDATIGRIGQWLGWYSGPQVLRVKFKPQPPGTLEPLWESSDARAGERVVVEHGEGATLRFGYGRGDQPPRWSERVNWLPGHEHPIELQLPSLHGPADRWGHGFRRKVSFRERSAVAIWFGGKRIFATIAAPLERGHRAGGSVSARFSSEAARRPPRLLREDELPLNGEGIWSVAGPAPLPGHPAVALVTTGRPGAGNAVSLACVRPGTGQLTFDRWGKAPHASPEFALPATDKLTVEMELAPVWPWSAAADEEQPLSVWINGRLVWETRGRLHQSDTHEVFLARNAIGATTCASVAGWTPAPPWPRGYGGTLRLRLIPAHPIDGGGEPLIAFGALYGSDIAGIRGTGRTNEARIFFEHFGVLPYEGRPFTLAPFRVHTAEVTLPSFHPDRFGEPATGHVIMRIDGEEVFRIQSNCHRAGDTTSNIGRNRFGGRVCGPAFRGWLLDWRWMGTMDIGPARRPAVLRADE